jgi:hypothetical protein
MLTASCHCGAVVLEIARKPRKLTECNCSICRRYGALWAYYSRETARVVRGQDSLAAYMWGGRFLEFYRCAICGCVTHHERTKKSNDSTVGVNARNMDPEVVAEIKIGILDGASTWKVLHEYVQPHIFRSPRSR